MVRKLLKCTSSPLAKLWLLVVFVMTSVAASAAVEWKTFEIGTKYQFAFAKQHFKFTPTEDGILKIYERGNTATVISTKGDDEKGVLVGEETAGGDWISYNIAAWKFKGMTDEDGTVYKGYREASLKAGVTYYIMAAGSITPKDEFFKGFYEGSVKEMKLVESNFEEGKIFDITDTRYGQLDLKFNLNADADSAIVAIGRYINTKIETRTSTNSGQLSFLLKDSINSWLDKGLISGGEEMTITIPNVHAAVDASIKYGTDGTLVLKFIAPGKPHQMTESKLPDPFLSYWVKGDENGKAVFTFDTDVMAGDQQTAVATLMVGSADAGDVYYEQLDKSVFSAEGNKLYVDFTDKLRTYEVMGLKTHYGSIKFNIQNIKMADGTNVYSGGKGTSGSFTYNMYFEEYKTNVMYEFTPANGGTLTDNNIKLYFSEKNAIKFGGVRITYQSQDDKKYQVRVTEGITSTEEGNNGIEYTIPISDDVKNAKNVRIFLEDVVANDGLSHSDITAKFNPGLELLADFEPTSSSVADGAVVTSLKNIVLTFDENVVTNELEIGQATFKDLATGKVIYGYVGVNPENGKSALVTPDEDLKDTHKYEITINEGVIANQQYQSTDGKYGRYMTAHTYTVTLYAKFGSLDFMTDPVEGSVVNQISTIKCTTRPGASASTYGVSWANRTDKEVYLLNENKERVATAKVADCENGFSVTFTPAITEPGKYTVHVADSVYFLGEGFEAVQNDNPVEFSYTVIAAPTELKVTATPADESKIETLDKITLEATENLYGTDTHVTAYCMTTRKSYDGVLSIDADDSKKATIVFLGEDGNGIKEEGGYNIAIPAGVFGNKTWNDNDGMTGKCNAAINLFYEVGNSSSDDSDVKAVPANNSTVASLDKITLTFAEYIGLGSGTITVKKDGAVIKTGLDADLYYESDDAWDTNIAEINYPLTEAGVYTFEIPEGYFCNDNGDVPAFTLTYTVGSTDGIGHVTVESANGTVYTLTGIKVGNSTKDLKGAFIVNGKKVILK